MSTRSKQKRRRPAKAEVVEVDEVVPEVRSSASVLRTRAVEAELWNDTDRAVRLRAVADEWDRVELYAAQAYYTAVLAARQLRRAAAA